MNRYKFFLCVIMCYNTFISVAQSEIYLEKLDTIYLPYVYEPSPKFSMSKGAAEQSAYDPWRKLVFSVGNININVVNATDPTNLHVITHHSLGEDAEMTDVEICGEYIVVGVDNRTVREEGRVLVFRYDEVSNSLITLVDLVVGALPDMIYPSKNCNTVFVALEAEAYIQDNVIIDPEGGLGIIQWDPSNRSADVRYRVVDFKQFNDRVDEYISRGVRFVYRENNNTLSQDLEPEYITLNEDETLAFVCLQENNAIAVVNITNLDTAEVIDLYSLGEKLWMESTFDSSDEDNGINLKPWPVKGLYLPDAIHYVLHDGQGYLITANEGDSKEYGKLFSEESRGSHFISNNLLDSSVTDDMREYLKDKRQLGRLKFSLSSGQSNETGKYSGFYAYGGRGMSIFRTSDMSIVYDSGDIVERSILERFPALFNSDIKPHETPWLGVDGRSDDKGPECESLSYGKLWNKTLIFMGNERPGTISVFSIDRGSFTPKFESVNFGGVIKAGRTWQEMYDRRTSGDLDPEDVRYIDPEVSGNGEPLLLVSGSVSGTISMYAVRMREVEFMCKTDELKCRNRELCVKLTFKCDGVDDCGDMSDEAQCTLTVAQPVTCKPEEMKCRNTNLCFSNDVKCDGVNDCGDNSDEINCNQITAMERSLLIVVVVLSSITVALSLGICCGLRNRKGKQKMQL